MRNFISCLGISLAASLVTLPLRAEVVLQPLPQPCLTSPMLESLGIDEQLWNAASDRTALVTAIDHSLSYLETDAAHTAYLEFAIPGISRDRVQRSLRRFRELVLTATSASALQTAIRREFVFYQSVGDDGLGTVSFTGYFEPTYVASRVRTDEFRYPLYRKPAALDRWSLPHPTRAQLEGEDGQGGSELLQGLELVWLRDRLEAYLIQVQGSARLQMTDGSALTVGYAGRTDYPYVSIGRELVNDGKIAEANLSLPVVIQYLQSHPDELSDYLLRNNRVVFFRQTNGAPPTGSLGVPVTAERSIATDKSVFPPGALALIQTQIPTVNSEGALEPQTVSRFVLDQDTGGAIQGAGRVDIFMGSGTLAGDRAGLINHPGRLFYLLLRDE